MTRFIKLVVAVAVAILALPSIASALGISLVDVSGPGASGRLLPGETVTFDLVLENDGREDVLGVGISVDGYDTPDLFGIYDGNLAFQSGASSSSVLDQVIPGVTRIVNLPGVNEGPYETFEVNNFRPNAHTTIIFQAASLTRTNQDGQLDLGIAGNSVLGGTGDVHFRVTFVSAPSGPLAQDLTINFNLDAIGVGGIVLPTTGATFDLKVIPEPGTALLMGIGLAGLSMRRR